MSNGGIGRAGARGAGMTLLGQGGKIGIQFASIVVLSRLLSPADFGLVAMLGVFTALGELVRDFGLTAAWIRAPELSRRQKSTLFWINFGIGFALFAVMTAYAVPISLLYGESRLAWLTPVVAAIFIINGLQAQFMVELVRNLRFAVLAISDVVGQFAGFAAAVISALAGLGYWALAIQMVTTFFVTLLIRVGAARWRPGLPSRSANVGELLRFGGHVGVSQLLSYAANNVGALVVGLRSDAQTLGFYNRAYQLISLPVYQLLNPLTNVALPLLARVRDERERFWTLVATAQAAIGYMLVLVLVVVAGNAEAAFDVLLGPQWAASVPIFQVLVVGACFQVLAFADYWVFLTFGIGKSLLWCTLVTKSIGIAFPIIGSAFGILGVAAGYSLALLISWPINQLWLRSAVQAPSARLLASGLRVLVLGTAAFLVSRLVGIQTAEQLSLVSLIASIVAAMAFVLLAVGVFPPYRRDFHTVRKAAGLLRSRG